AGQHGAGGAIAIGDGELVPNRPLLLDGRPRQLDELPVEHLVEAVILPLAIVDGDAAVDLRLVEQLREIEAPRLPVADGPVLIQDLRLADHLVERAEAERGHVLAYLLRDVEEEVDDVLRLALE